MGQLGDTDRCRAAIQRAEEARERVDGGELDEFGGIMTFPAPRKRYYAADATIWLAGEEEEAAQRAEGVIEAYKTAANADRSFSDEAGARADLALARSSQHDVEGPAEAPAEVLDLPVDQRIEGIAASVKRVQLPPCSRPPPKPSPSPPHRTPRSTPGSPKPAHLRTDRGAQEPRPRLRRGRNG